MTMRRTRNVVTALGIVPLLAAAGMPGADEPSVDVAKTGTARDGAAVLRVSVVCPSGWQVLEAHVSATQDEGRVSGTTGIPGIRCDGRQQRIQVTVNPYEGAFAPGEATASPYLLVLREGSSETASAGSFSVVRLNGAG